MARRGNEETERGAPGEWKPPGIHVENVSRFFAEHVPGADVPLGFELLGGGRSNVTYLVRGAGREWVLRRPPLGHVLPTAHDMAREYRVLAALADTDVPVPRPFAFCEDPSVNDAPFYSTLTVRRTCSGGPLSILSGFRGVPRDGCRPEARNA